MKLPPLPGSDPKTLQQNKYDTFYQKTPKGFWGAASVENIELFEPKKCDCHWIEIDDGYLCKKCKRGLKGLGLSIKEGKLYANKKLII